MSIFDEIAQIVGPQNISPIASNASAIRGTCPCIRASPSGVYAKTTEQVSAIMKLATGTRSRDRARFGHSTTGAVLPIQGGILLDLHSMNKCWKSTRRISMPGLNPV